MKLNGKIYITKKQLLEELEDLVLDLELRNFRDIQDDLEDLDSNNIDEILDLFEDVKRDILMEDFFNENDKFVDLNVINE